MEDILSIYTINHKEELESIRFNVYKSSDKNNKLLSSDTHLITHICNERLLIWNRNTYTLSIKNTSSNTIFTIATCKDISNHLDLQSIMVGFLPSMSHKLYLVDKTGIIYCSRHHLIFDDEILSRSNKSDFDIVYRCTGKIISIFQRDMLWYIFYIESCETYLDVRSYDFKLLVHRIHIYPSKIDACSLYGTCILFLVENNIYMRQLFDHAHTHLLTLPDTANYMCTNLEKMLICTDTSSYLVRMRDLITNNSDLTIIELPICKLHYKTIQFHDDLQWNTHIHNKPFVSCEYLSNLQLYQSFQDDIDHHFNNSKYIYESEVHDSHPFKNIHYDDVEIFNIRDKYNIDDLYDFGSIFKCYKRIYHTPQNHIKKWRLIQDFIANGIHVRTTSCKNEYSTQFPIIEIVSNIGGCMSAFIYKHPVSGLIHYVLDNSLLAKHINVVGGNHICLYSSIAINHPRKSLWLTQPSIDILSSCNNI